MAISVLDLFKIGIGPSSSHTVGPMRAARGFAEALEAAGLLTATAAVRVELFGSLGATGRGHASDKAVILGLLGETPAMTISTEFTPVSRASMNRAAADSGLAWRRERMRSVSTLIRATPAIEIARSAPTASAVVHRWPATHRTTRASARSTGPSSKA